MLHHVQGTIPSSGKSLLKLQLLLLLFSLPLANGLHTNHTVLEVDDDLLC